MASTVSVPDEWIQMFPADCTWPAILRSVPELTVVTRLATVVVNGPSVEKAPLTIAWPTVPERLPV